MSGIISALRETYIRFLVWLGAEPPPGYEYLIGGEVSPRQYTLQPGETIYSVARKFEVHDDLIAQANNIEDPSSVKPGQTLVIPAPDWTPPPEPVAITAPVEAVVKEAPVEELPEQLPPPVVVEEEPEWLAAPEV